MKVLAGIRTYHWGEEEDRLLAALHPVFGDDLVAVVQNPAEDLECPVKMVPMPESWAVDQGLHVLANWGWRCGDYAYYAMRQAHPDYDFYWLIEPDVYFSSSPSPFFEAFQGDHSDALGAYLKSYPSDHRFSLGMPDIPLYNAIFPLTRLSAAAIDLLLKARIALRTDIGNRFYPNDEVFVFSSIMAAPGMSVTDIGDVAPFWIDESWFNTDPTFLIDALLDDGTAFERIYHPVRTKDAFKAALSQRLTSRLAFLKKMSGSLAHLEDDDIDDVIAATGGTVRNYIRSVRRKGWQEIRKRRKTDTI